MKKKKVISKRVKDDLKQHLKNRKISFAEVAEEGGVTYRSVAYFFSDNSNSSVVYNACLRLMQKRIKDDLKNVANNQEILTELSICQ